MAKRIADKELTDRNWDQEDEGEEAGMFSIASEDVMKNRPIKKAKRRAPGTEGESGGAFKAFKGFSVTGSAPGGGGAFPSFGNGAGFKPVSTMANGSSRASATPSFPGFASAASTTTPAASLTFNGPASSPPPTAEVTSKQPNGSAPSLAQSSAPGPAQSWSSSSSSSSSGSSSSSRGREYSRQLTALNCSVRDWIDKHVNDNPLCDLNPIFRDYERHLASIEQKYGTGAGPESQEKGGNTEGSQPAAAGSSSSSSASQAPSSGATAPALFPLSGEKESGPPPAGVSFNFGKKVDSSVLGSLGASAAPLSFSFSSQGSLAPLFGGQGATTTTPAATFSFGGAKTEAASSQKTEDQNGGADEESEEPPKPVITEVKEEDAFYSKKCKLFYKKENEFKEKGVGTLHLKHVAEGKTQLLVRADTNLGNILLNILVPASMPCSRKGKNNVMVVCVPNPPVDDKNPAVAVPLLIRVKTAEDADELHKMLQEKA
ncbi:nuclear pore complex protein Nup50 [Anguilla rostrata]|uniref:nuclear pore complex protein Nup50 n=1 Tax=Anguilla rostrata TaxID=7938 RepID=UPI0030CC87E4